MMPMLDNAPQLPGVRLVPRPAEELPAQVDALTQLCIDDLFSAFGLGGLHRGRRSLEFLSRIPARRLARQIAAYDGIVGESGLAAGGAWALERMSRRAEIEGRENVPRQGPLLLVSNHPGLADAVALFAAIPRPDLRIVAAERPFLSALPNTSRHLLTVDEGSPGHLGVVRRAVRHLHTGGAVLTFPGGRIEPDPAVLSGAGEALEHWSSSVELFARREPGLTVVPVLVSGVISSAALRNPLVFLRRQTEDRRWLAATFQMLIPALRRVTTQVTFGTPIKASDTGSTISSTVLEEMRRLIHQRQAGW